MADVPRDRRLTRDLATRRLDREVLDMYEKRSAPKCNGFSGIHSASKGKKATVALVRPDGRPLAWSCDACIGAYARAYGCPEEIALTLEGEVAEA